MDGIFTLFLDTTPPTVSCPANVTYATGPDAAFALVPMPQFSAWDNVGISSEEIDVSIGQTPPFCVEDICEVFLGVTEVIFKATDSVGNSATCSMSVTVIDNQLPTIYNCPSDILAPTDADKLTAVISWPIVSASDNSGTVNFVPSDLNGSVFPLGITPVYYTATDPSGNSAACQFTVTIFGLFVASCDFLSLFFNFR